MSNVTLTKAPTVGGIVLFFAKEGELKFNPILPAIIIRVGDDGLTLQVFTTNTYFLNVLKQAIPHKSHAKQNQSYWDWPETN